MTTETKTRSIWDLLSDPAAGGVSPWLRWGPDDLDECVRARGDRLPDPLDAGERDELRQAHARWGADAASLEGIDKLGEAGARVVVTGQQPGIFVGPLYSVYKTLTSVLLARELAARHGGLTFVPVFWIASEDHDFDEVRRAQWPGSSGALEAIFADHPDWSPGRMIGTLPAEPLAENLQRRVHNSTFETEFRKEVLELIAEAYGPGQTWEDAAARILLRLFRDTGLVIVSPLMRWVRRRAAPILAAEAAEPGASSAAVIERGEQLVAAGIEAPLHRRPGAINFFWVDGDRRRHPLRVEGGEIVAAAPAGSAPSDDAPVTLAADAPALADRVMADPEAFSFNVVTRPLAQDSILPTVAQVVGPGEAAYFPQVEALYERFGVFAPVRYPRARALLVPNNVARTLAKYDLDLKRAIDCDAIELARHIIRRDMDEGLVHEARELRDRHLTELKELGEKAGSNPSIAGAFTRLGQAMRKGYGTVEERILYSRQEDERHLSQAMARVEHNLRPGGHDQERVLNPVVPFAVNHGLDWVARLGEEIKISMGEGFQTIYLKDL